MASPYTFIRATVRPNGRTERPFGRTVRPFGRTVRPFGRTVRPFGRTVRLFGRTVRPFGRNFISRCCFFLYLLELASTLSGELLSGPVRMH